jgi:hypothetical protein
MRTTLVGCLLLIALASCGGNRSPLTSSESPTVDPGLGLTGQLPAIPAAGHFVPQKAVSESTAQRSGASAETVQGGTPEAFSLQLTSAPNEVAYALFRFTGVPGEAISTAGFSGTGLSAGGKVWLALADYTTKRWVFQAPSTLAAKSFTVNSGPGRYVSTGGDIHVLVVVFGGDNFTLDTVSLTYAARHTITGFVWSEQGIPVPGATVSTPLYNLVATTDANGDFSLGGLPDGDWPLVATKSGWTFYDNPQAVTVAGGDTGDVIFKGHEQGANFLPRDPTGYDDSLAQAQAVDLSGGPLDGTLSIVDDRDDYYRLTLDTPGTLWIEMRDLTGGILFPLLEVFDDRGVNLATSYYALAGAIRVPLDTVTTPREFIVHTSLSGGGGSYQLQLGSGVLSSLKGYVGKFNAQGRPEDFVGHARVHVTPASGGHTDYWTEDGGTFEDGYRPAVATTVVVTSDGYTFTPSSDSVDLTNGDATSDFLPVVGSFADDHEPNTTLALADANASLALPYDSGAAADSLTIDTKSDDTDFYRLSPAAGEGVRVRLSTASASEAAVLRLDICDSTGTPINDLGRAVDGHEARLITPSDGGACYIKVSASPTGKHLVRYTLIAQSYLPHALTFKNMLAGAAVGGAKVELYDVTFRWHRTLNVNASGTTAPLLSTPGEWFNTELLRYGFSTDRSTRGFQMPSADLQVTFDAVAAASADKLEPNNDMLVGTLRALPLTTLSTVDPQTDPSDFFLVMASQNKPLQVTFNLQSTERIGVTLYDDVGTLRWSGEAVGSTPLLLGIGMTGLQRLEVREVGAPLAYQLQVSQTSAFRIRGVATDGAAGVPGTRVYCPEVGHFSEVQANGNYDLGLVLPGTYTVQCFCPGYAVPTDQVVTISNSDVLANFTLTAAPFDSDEPDGSFATATVLLTDGTPTSVRTIGLSGDDADYCKLTAAANQVIEITADRLAAWHYAPLVMLLDAAGSTVAVLEFADSAQATIAARAPGSGTYYVYASGGPAEYRVSVKVN